VSRGDVPNPRRMQASPSPFESQEPTRSTPVPPNLRSHGLWAFESRHDPKFAMPVTAHAFFKLLLIREGAGAIEFEGAETACESGDLVLVPARVRHRIIDLPRAPIALYGLGVDLHPLHSAGAVIEGFKAEVQPASRLRTLRIEQRLRKILYLNDQSDAASQLSSVATAIDLLAELSLLIHPPRVGGGRRSIRRQEARTHDDPVLEAYLVWLHRNFYESLSLDDAASATGMSRRTFTNLFKARTGTTWLDYVNILRIRHAEVLLKQTDRKITSIAFQCGYDDLTTFYRAFKRIHGKNPSAWRS
jgi:AraC-like DNA-binding protein/mannose-6-phosphate isomerase-like protein (cupin superfamily)